MPIINDSTLQYKDQIHDRGNRGATPTSPRQQPIPSGQTIASSKHTVQSGGTGTHTNGTNESGDGQGPNEINIPLAYTVEPQDNSCVQALFTKQRWILWLMALVVILATVIGAFCGTGNCSNADRSGSTPTVDSSLTADTSTPPAPSIRVRDTPSANPLPNAGSSSNADTEAPANNPTNGPSASTDPPTTAPNNPTNGPSTSTNPPTKAPITTIVNVPANTGAPSAGDNTDAMKIAIVDYINSITLFTSANDDGSSSTVVVPYPPVTSSPEELALQWLVDTDPISRDPANPDDQFRLRQRYALLTLFQSAYANDDSWYFNDDECQWFGIRCDQENNVNRIDLFGNNLPGQLSADLGLLTNMVYFSVSTNAFSGTLPPSIGMWTNLEIFSVFSNSLAGTIPATIASWGSIQEAYFYENFFVGSIPIGICPYFADFLDADTDPRRLVADCVAGTGKVTCDCCTGCV
jgi:hypothetical protein